MSGIDIGWIKIHRKIRNWKYYGKLKYEKVWQMMLMEANYDDQDFKGITVKRGELIFSRGSYLEKLSKCDPKITDRNLRTILSNLKKDGQILIKSVYGRKFSIISINNYADYQKKETPEIIQEELKRLKLLLAEKKKEIDKLSCIKTAIDAQKTDQVNDMETQGKPTPISSKSDMKNIGLKSNSRAFLSKDEDGHVTPKQHKGDMETQGKPTNGTTILKERKEKIKENYNNIKKGKIEKNGKKQRKIIEIEEREKEKDRIFSIVTETIDYFNKVTGQSLRVTEGGGHYKIISKRIKENYTLNDFKNVINQKVTEWMGTKWQGGLTTKKLFGDEFDSFLNKSKFALNDDFMSKSDETEREEIKRREEAFNDELERINNELDEELEHLEKSNKIVVPLERNNSKNIYDDNDSSPW